MLHMDGGMGWWMVFGSLWFVLFWGLIIWAIVRITDRGTRVEAPAESALEILRRRYARGEIDRAQFDQMSHDLGAKDEAPPLS